MSRVSLLCRDDMVPLPPFPRRQLGPIEKKPNLAVAWGADCGARGAGMQGGASEQHQWLQEGQGPAAGEGVWEGA